MNISTFLRSLANLKSENISNSQHFSIRHEERKDDVMPEIDGIHKMLISGEAVEVSQQDDQKFRILFNLNEKYDLALVVSVKNTNPEIIIRLITCYKIPINRRVR